VKRAVVFGTFDRFHPGHEWFLSQASTLCDHLIVTVALDEDVQRRKGHRPHSMLSERIGRVQHFLPHATVNKGDKQEGEWSAFLQEPIDLCIVGYDQTTLRGALETLRMHRALSFDIIQLDSYFPERYKTSLYV